MTQQSLRDYLAALEAALKRGDAREHTHRPDLKTLIEAASKRLTVTNEPARDGPNAPDMIVSLGIAPIGHIETKDVGDNLDKTLKTDQLKRYREALPNLILTDYLQFIWLVDGEERARVKLGDWNGKKITTADAESAWQGFIAAFLNHRADTVRSPTQLALKLAAQTRLLKLNVLDILQQEQGNGELTSEKAAFEATLLPNLTDDEFADMFAQTIAYGLFTARRFDRTLDDFSRQEAAGLIPKSNPFLRRFFQYIAGYDLHSGLEWIVDNMAELLGRVDMTAILEHYGKKRGFEDPVFHFYEHFLAAYDQKLRESRGVYYTPEPVVDFIVRGVDSLLQSRFNRPEGLANRDTVILDPAVGTATFLRNVLQQIRSRMIESGQAGMWSSYVREGLLPRLFGFELMMAPYTVAHLKLALELADTGYEFREGERINIFLTNTLDEIHHKSGTLLTQWLSEEAEAAERVKKQTPVQVVLGNPPYSGISENKSAWIESLIAEYKKEPDGSPLKEHKHWLNDDYVKFIRFAHWRVVQTGHGIVAFITNHGWLDNPTFRGMRASLLRDFDEIYVLDLHGHSQKSAPDGREDKNVFDIQQGVAILFLVRREGRATEAPPARVYHAELWGSREAKYDWLEETEFNLANWCEITPRLNDLVFKPEKEGPREEYEQGWKVTDIFPVNSTGILTARDHFSLDFEREALEARIQDFIDPTQNDDMVRARYFGTKHGKYPPGDTRGWKLTEARKTLRSMSWQNCIQPCLYRPFDKRFVLYDKAAIDWGRWEVMHHMLKGDNLALITSRMTKGETYQHTLVSDSISEVILLSPKTSNNAFVFPLWLAPTANKKDLFDEPATERRPNLAPAFITALRDKLGFDPAPETTFHYLYAVLHSPTYRSRYAEYLKSDFPRVPLTADRALFERLAGLGEKLVALHLLTSPELDHPTATYPVDGSHTVEKVRFDAPAQRVCFNATQYFCGVSQSDWDFHIGGYRVLEKWLKDRKGRALSLDDIAHYRKIIATVAATRGLMKEIDAAITTWPIQ